MQQCPWDVGPLGPSALCPKITSPTLSRPQKHFRKKNCQKKTPQNAEIYPKMMKNHTKQKCKKDQKTHKIPKLPKTSLKTTGKGTKMMSKMFLAPKCQKKKGTKKWQKKTEIPKSTQRCPKPPKLSTNENCCSMPKPSKIRLKQ